MHYEEETQQKCKKDKCFWENKSGVKCKEKNTEINLKHNRLIQYESKQNSSELLFGTSIHLFLYYYISISNCGWPLL